MFYPTIIIGKDIHAIDNEYTTLCNIEFQKELPKELRLFFRRVCFKNINEITCMNCKAVLRQAASYNLFNVDRNSSK